MSAEILTTFRNKPLLPLTLKLTGRKQKTFWKRLQHPQNQEDTVLQLQHPQNEEDTVLQISNW